MTVRPVLACFLFASASAVALAADTDWPEYLGGPDRSHYSPLDQIDRTNVAHLTKAWEFHSGDPGQVQCNPLVIDGVLYGTTASDRVFALDAASGAPLWVFTAKDIINPLDTHRGLAYWTNGSERRILTTVGPWLYAIDANNGEAADGFGNRGRVSLKAGLGPQAQDKFVVSTTPGTVFGDLIIMPTRVEEDQDAAPGTIQAFNIRTGTLAWVFHTIPYPGEPGYETWSKDAFRNLTVGSANCWAGTAVDRARGILYVPTGSAAPDFWGGHRLGTGVYADCLLALDAATGKLLWYKQTVHHDLWDRDLPAPPVLVTVNHNGRRVDAVAQTTKTGFVFLFDRVSGESLFPIEERPFPASTLKGEGSWPTQPIPLKPAPFARQTLSETDVSPYAENKAELLQTLHTARKGLFQPFGTDKTLLFPGFDGGAEWGGPAVDPNGILYVNASNMAWLVSLSDSPLSGDLAKLGRGRRLYTEFCSGCHGPELQGLPAGGIPSLVGVSSRHPRDEVVNLIASGRRMMPGFPILSEGDRKAIVAYVFGEEKAGAPAAPQESLLPEPPPRIPYHFDGYNRFVDSKGYPAITPPWGTLTAVDLNTGETLWQSVLGEFKELKAKGIPPTGAENYGGPVVTAGGVLFIAATKDGMFRAFDTRTGRVLWETELPAGGFATPATYEVAGKQFVVVAACGDKLGTKAGDSYVAYALP